MLEQAAAVRQCIICPPCNGARQVSSISALARRGNALFLPERNPIIAWRLIDNGELVLYTIFYPSGKGIKADAPHDEGMAAVRH